MGELLNTLGKLLRLKAGPQDLPASWSLTLVMLAVYIGQRVITGQNLGIEHAAASTMMSAVIAIAALVIMLRYRKVPERLAQTLLAFALTGTVVGIVEYLLLVQADPSINQPVLGLMWFVVFGWSLAVDANIYRQALSIPMAQGVLISVVLLGLGYIAQQLAFA